jgi:hypothetical protein
VLGECAPPCVSYSIFIEQELFQGRHCAQANRESLGARVTYFIIVKVEFPQMLETAEFLCQQLHSRVADAIVVKR